MSYHSHADLGGQDGHGPVVPAPDEAVFHARWEAEVLGLALAMGATGQWNLDMSRSARETLPDYRVLDYYGIWHEALRKLLKERGLVTEQELTSGEATEPARPLARILRGTDVQAALGRGTPTLRPALTAALFQLGDRVRTLQDPAVGHTRLPGYARGKRGVVERIHGPHVFADAHALGQGEQPEWLYTVAFDASELWSEGAGQGVRVSIDAWEPYLERTA